MALKGVDEDNLQKVAIELGLNRLEPVAAAACEYLMWIIEQVKAGRRIVATNMLYGFEHELKPAFLDPLRGDTSLYNKNCKRNSSSRVCKILEMDPGRGVRIKDGLWIGWVSHKTFESKWEIIER